MKRFYSIHGIIILLCCIASLAQARAAAAKTLQEITVSGTVRDESGLPVQGVSVTSVASVNGAATDSTGKYEIQVSKLPATIVFSMVGFESQSIETSDRVLDIRIVSAEGLIDEVVVVGYGTQRKVNLTGAVNSVSMDQLVGNRPVGSVANALLGSVPGLNVSGNSSEPGATSTFNIRGISSINGGDPLILVNNVPMEIADINPDDISTISVLKDASAAAIYGARAAFGVVLITTKTAENDQPTKLAYAGKLSMSAPQEFAQKASPLETMVAMRDAGYVTKNAQVISTWIDLLEQYEKDPTQFPEGFTHVDGVRYALEATDVTRDLIENNGRQNIHDLSVSGGSSRNAYRVSVGIMDEDGIMKSNKDHYRRYNASAFQSIDISDWLRTQVNMMYSDAEKSDPSSSVWGMTTYLPSVYPLGGTEIDGDYYLFETPRNMFETSHPDVTNTQRLSLLGRVILTPLKGLTFTTEFSMNRKKWETTSYTQPRYNFVDGMTMEIKSPSTTDATYREDKMQDDSRALNMFATYNYAVGEHSLTATGGINVEKNAYEDLWAERLQMINDDLPSIGQGVGALTAGDNFTETSIFGTFYRLNYAFKDRYLVEATGRYDGSSKFPKDNRFGFFPSFSAGWRMSEERFMLKLKPVLSNLKIRGSWGSIGNQDINPYSYMAGMSSTQTSWLTAGERARTLTTPALVRSNFTWEEIRTTNLGLDVALFNNQLSGSFDIFRRTTLDMLGPGVDYPSVIGAAAPLQNAADMYTRGWEAELGWNGKGRSVMYGLAFNIGDNVSKITRFRNETKILTSHYVGKTMGEIWGYEVDRFYTEDDFVEGSLKATAAGELTGGTLKEGIPKVKGYNPNPGDFLYKHADENGEIWAADNTFDNPGSKRIIGNSNPRYVFGFRGHITYKDFTVNAFVQGTGSRQLWMMNGTMVPHSANFEIALYDYQTDYWTPENRDAHYARLYQSAGYNTAANNAVNDRYLLDASYIDIKSISLSYNVPARLFKGLNLDRFTVFVNGENIWSFNHLPTGTHPDNSLRARGSTYPYMRMFTAGANIQF